MSVMSCMSPCGRACVPILETYLAPLLSILPTRQAVDRRPRDPGGGCVISAAGGNRIDDVVVRDKVRGLPMTIVGFAVSLRKEISCSSGTTFVQPSFTLILIQMSGQGIEEVFSMPTLSRYSCSIVHVRGSTWPTSYIGWQYQPTRGD
jgi:hypothetical protein